MTKKELSGMKTGDMVIHKWLGKCTVQEIMYCITDFFGLVLLPETDEGKERIQRHFGTPIGTPFLEGSLRMVKPVRETGAGGPQA
jgi:hypothetical protein